MQATRTLRQTQEPRLENYPFLTVVLQLSNADSLSHAAPRMVKNLKRFEKAGFRSHNFLAQLLSETSTACTIRVRRSNLERLGDELGAHAGLDSRNRRPGTSTEERIPGRREPDPESPNQRPVAVIRCRKRYVGGDRPPAGTESLGRIGGCRET